MSKEQQNTQETVEPIQDAVENLAETEACEPSAAEESAADLLQKLEESRAEVDALKKELAELQPRAQAEIQNIRRRAEQDVEKAHKFGLEKFANELLPVVDSLERAIEASQGDDEAMKAIREGVEMTLSMFLGSMEKFNVEQLNPEGQPFNPEHHQAMSMVPAEGVEPNTVVTVIQKGYLLNGRLMRPAMVMVAKG
ncbi:nucleotide exchange factor GrpE [Marinobacterium sediminicola]|uniref:Protein GrpE n=1 Tax=Marinobacterium sediminicola TaxID=518898 RepID=A0ABY1S0H0_9GAMM|nr:nucleotide exchange factor GrpE [Marinobacterium sediminicola]ULG69576.1 nucleotide exchange factor GrpE [Marinobacterium sediminicola]SMR74696.1 molecular chaperone GrpE [Marinobacterium sediminicola]